MSQQPADLTDDELRARYAGVDREAGEGDPGELDRLAAEWLRRHPDDAAFWYDRGMYAKWRRDWPASLEFNRRSLDLIPADRRVGDPTCWNLGIAATALRDWATARQAWAGFGIDLPGEAGPIVADFGAAPVRLNPHPRFAGEEWLRIDGEEHATEVVWGRRLCPARIEILNVPTPDSGHRCGDVVLHDGDPVGTRRLGDRDVSVFNEIELWDRSPVPTLTTLVKAPDDRAVEELIRQLEQVGAAQDWTATLNLLCRACSEGDPTLGHDHGRSGDRPAERTLGISADPDRARAVLDGWSKGRLNRRSYRDLSLALT